MSASFPIPARLMSVAALASFAITAACTGELEPENAEEGMIPTEITTEGEGEADPVDATAPGVGEDPEDFSDTSADTDQPTFGADAVPEDR